MTQGETDQTLLEQWREGDEAAGNRLVRRHFSRVFGFFAGKVDRPEDLAQRTFMACLENHDKYWASASFRAFLFGFARRILLRHFREQRRGGNPVSFEDQSIDELSPTPSEIAAAQQEHKVLLAALRKIPVDHQITLELFFWEDQSVAEIAEILDVRPGTVKSRLHRAKAMLREVIESMDIAEELRRTTLGNLEGWARSVRRAVPDGPG